MSEANELVCVTGATGFIAAHIVRELLRKGYRVRGTVRDVEGARHKLSAAGINGTLELVRADLLEPGSFDAALAGCTYVIHTASPYAIAVKDPQKELVDPALGGTNEVLAAAARVGTIKRVVLTSSVAAMSDEPDHKLTEADWNTKSSLRRNPYFYSKALAERAAWKFMETDKPRFSLVVINPFMVIGPSLTPALNQSTRAIGDVLTSKGYPGIVSLSWGFVDVRDVALAHVMAMATPKAKGRYVCAAQTLDMREVVKVFDKHGLGAKYKLPRMNLANGLGNFLARVGSWFQPRGIGSFVRTHIGRRVVFDNGKIKRELGITFRSAERSLIDTVADLERWGHLAGRAKKGAPAAAQEPR